MKANELQRQLTQIKKLEKMIKKNISDKTYNVEKYKALMQYEQERLLLDEEALKELLIEKEKLTLAIKGMKHDGEKN